MSPKGDPDLLHQRGVTLMKYYQLVEPHHK